MRLSRRIRLALAAVLTAPLLTACAFTGDVDLTDQGLFTVDLLVTDSSDMCDQDMNPTLLQGLTLEKGEQDSECRITGTVASGLAAMLGITVTHDLSGYQVRVSDDVVSWADSSVDVKVRFPGPITEVDGAEQTGSNELRVVYTGPDELTPIRVVARDGYGPSTLEWAAGLGLLAGVALTLLGLGLVRLRRKRVLLADSVAWPPPEGVPAGPETPRQVSPNDAAFWSGAAESAIPVIGERSRRSGSDPSVWAPPQG
jgi:hypothetical protein